MRRALAIALGVAALAAIAYQLLLREERAAGRVALPVPAAVIGSGSDAVAVSGDGRVLAWLPVPEDAAVPTLPLREAPAGGRLRGPALAQARVLGAAPRELRPHIAGSSFGEQGVVVELRAGIELRFGDASQPARKWRAAAAVLADPELEALDYVNLQAPGRPAVGGSGYALPPPP